MKVNWISVKDRLPEPYVSVFVYGKRIENITAVDRCDEKYDITHWAEIEYPVPPAYITRYVNIGYPDPPADDEL